MARDLLDCRSSLTFYRFLNLACIHTRYIFSCRFRLSSNRRSIPICCTVNIDSGSVNINSSEGGTACSFGNWSSCSELTLTSSVVSRTLIETDGGKVAPVNILARSSAQAMVISRKYNHWLVVYTLIKEVHPSFIPTNVKILAQKSSLFESDLCQVVPAVISQEDNAARFEELLAVANSRNEFYEWNECLLDEYFE